MMPAHFILILNDEKPVRDILKRRKWGEEIEGNTPPSAGVLMSH